MQPNKDARQDHQEACVDEVAPEQIPGEKKKKGGLQRVEARTGNLGRI